MKVKQILKKVMVFGTFDILHPGHLNFFKKALSHGNYLVVVVARDKTVLEIKNKKPHHTERQRLKSIKKLNLSDKVILGNISHKYTAIKKYKPDIICLGYDQTFFTDKLGGKLKEFGLKTKIIRLKPYRPDIYKTTILKNAEEKQ